MLHTRSPDYLICLYNKTALIFVFILHTQLFYSLIHCQTRPRVCNRGASCRTPGRGHFKHALLFSQAGLFILHTRTCIEKNWAERNHLKVSSYFSFFFCLVNTLLMPASAFYLCFALIIICYYGKKMGQFL